MEAMNYRFCRMVYCGLAAVSDEVAVLWERVSVRAEAPCWRMLTMCGCMLVRVCSVNKDVETLDASSILQLNLFVQNMF